MLKHFIPAAVLIGVLAGCQSTPPMKPVEEPLVESALEQEKPQSEAVASEVNKTDLSATRAVAEEAIETKAVESETAEPETPPAAIAPVEVVLEPETTIEQPQQDERNKTMILMKTSKGDIKLELDAEKAPKTVESFLSYVKEGHYDGTIFHRVINGFMIQGGGFDSSMNQKPAPRTVQNEADNGLSNDVGTIAMARTPDPHSASAQFFINVKDNDFLNFRSKTPQGWGYCVFGKVVEGMEVVDAIKGVKTGSAGPFQDVPAEPIVINSVSVVEE